MTGHMWAALLIGLVVGIIAGFRLGTWYLPAMLGKIEAWALRGRIKQYRRRR
jgi:uncharacterized membrane-anchored protein YhcB (DUF1043 family)